METHSTAWPAGATQRSICVGGRRYPVILPSWRDPRLQVAAIILSLQAFGQASFGFQLSIAQILVAMGTCALLEIAIVWWRQRMLAWPASALLTGSGVAFILRVPGTVHGQWWSLHGAWIFAGTAALALLSKYWLRDRSRGQPLFNPSNLGLLVCFLVLGSARADPLDFWWAPMGPALIVALVLIVAGGLILAARVHMVGMTIAFWVTFVACTAVVAARGHAMTAQWHLGPISGDLYWWVLVTSPEVLVFMFFMITDPHTAPRGRVARIVFGAGIAFVAAALAATQHTEFGTKVALLGGLALWCALRPVLEHVMPTVGSQTDQLRRWLLSLAGNRADPSSRPALVVRRTLLSVAGVAAAIGVLVAAGIPAPAHSAALSVPSSGSSTADVALPHAQRVAVTLDSSLQSISLRMDQATAQHLAGSVEADLIEASTAVQHEDVAAAAHVAAGPWLHRLVTNINDARQTGLVTVAQYRLSRLTVLVVRTGSQAGPQLGVRAQGQVRDLTYLGTRLITDTSHRYDQTFSLLVPGPGRYLLFDNAR